MTTAKDFNEDCRTTVVYHKCKYVVRKFNSNRTYMTLRKSKSISGHLVVTRATGNERTNDKCMGSSIRVYFNRSLNCGRIPSGNHVLQKVSYKEFGTRISHIAGGMPARNEYNQYT
jgi:hypothetical protein